MGLAIAGALEGFGELGVMMDPGHQSVDGALWGEVGGVGHGNLGLAHGTHGVGLDFFFHDFVVLVEFNATKVVIFRELCK